MKLLNLLGSLALMLLLAASAADSATPQQVRKPGTYATFDTSMGSFVCELFEPSTPVTVGNFIGLAEGTKEWMTPKGDFVKKPYYDGVTFHRVIKGFAIQAGDVTRTGNFTAIPPFQDEIVRSIRFDTPGLLAMANNGPNTNRTQFFITVAPAPHLSGKHTIFGRVVEGFDVVKKISEVPVSGRRPVQDVVIRKLTISRAGKPAR
jgi:cyclophilin family peptidyl-prolyl cis-trans isomerase